MIEDDLTSDFWTVYDNATDKPVAYGSYDELLSALKMSKGEFEGILSRYRSGERDFTILGKKLNINIMLNGVGMKRVGAY